MMKRMRDMVVLALALALLAGAFSFRVLAEREDEGAGNGSVRISCNMAKVEVGDPVTLTANPTGFGGSKLAYQWQVNGGGGWEDIKNAVKPDYTFTYAEKMADYRWRVIVTEVVASAEPDASESDPEAEPDEASADPTDETASGEQADAGDADLAPAKPGDAEPAAAEPGDAEPAAEPDAPEHASEPTPEPASESATEPASESATEPASGQAMQPDPAPEPERGEPAQSGSSAQESKQELKPENNIADNEIPLSSGLDANGDGEIDIIADVETPANGDTVTLSTPLCKAGSDGSTLLFQWLVDRGDGMGFTPIEGANGKTYAYTHSDANAHYRYRVVLSVRDAAG